MRNTRKVALIQGVPSGDWYCSACGAFMSDSKVYAETNIVLHRDHCLSNPSACMSEGSNGFHDWLDGECAQCGVKR